MILSADSTSSAGRPDIQPGLLTLDRLAAGVEVQHRTNLPILVTGGTAGPGRMSLAHMMANALQADFGIKAAEGRSQDTWENAQNSAAS